jgi:hypothetical protein
MKSLLRSYEKLMRSIVKYLYRRGRVEQHWISGNGDHLRARVLFPDLLLLCIMPRDQKAPDRHTSVESPGDPTTFSASLSCARD